MNEVQIFPSKEFGDIRTAIIKGKEYFCGNDVASALCYQVPKNAISSHCKGALFWCPSDETQEMKYIPLGDVYRLIVKASSQSNNEEIKEKAERFEKLVFDEILPQIHKTGGYGVPQTIPEQIQLLAQGNVEVNKRMDAVEKEIQKLKDDMPVFQADAKDIQSDLRKKAVEALGGYKSPAYNDRSTRTYVFADIQRELRRQFDVKRYDQIKHKDAPIALEIISQYRLPLALKNRVDMANAQQSLNLKGGAYHG